MSLKNKFRNLQIFGFFQGKFKAYKKLLLGIVIITVFIFAGRSFLESKSPESITGEVIIGTTEDTQLTNQPPDSNEESNEESAESNEENETEELPKYYEYGGQCSYNIEKAEDDVSDILNYMQQDEEKYKSLKDEYNRKLQELKEQYEYNIEGARQQTDFNQEALQEAQEKLSELHEICAF